jgi:osmotically-inducible protein OsmY
MSLIKRLIVAFFMAVLLGCAGAGQSTGEYIDDSAITTKVKTKLFNDPVTGGWQITVITKNRVVQLAGFVKSSKEKDRASELARSVPGVKSVINDLVIK